MCKAQNKKVELLNEGQNRTFTSSLDNAEKNEGSWSTASA